ncbi:MAG: hypothetical protein ABL921_21865 [Pirellula sp.]
MGKKFTVDEFKITFNKPVLPKGVSSKTKDELESVVKELASNKERHKDVFTASAAQLFKDHEDYYVELLGYKMAKHWDGKERKIWIENSPKEAVEKVLDKLYKDVVMDEDKMIEELETCTSSKVVAYLYKKYPDLMTSVAKKKFNELEGKELESFGAMLPPSARTDFLIEGFENNDAATVQACFAMFPFLPQQKQMELAQVDLSFFIANVFLPSHMAGDNALTWLKDAKWRDILSSDKLAWKKLTDTMPILSVGEAAKKRAGEDATSEELADAIFDCVCENDGIELTYFTNPVDTDHALLGGPGEKDSLARQEQIDKLKREGYEEPDKPATQCHNLKGVVKQILAVSLGGKVVVTENQIENMLLTQPLSSVPGGLLPKTFGGNVCDDNGKLTGQVMFTGVGGKQSHTWLKINGVDYDPVLGTKGDQVAKSKADEFVWVIPELVGKGKGSGDFIIKDPKLQAAPNKHGFGSCYRLTQNPLKYIQGIYGITFETADQDIKVKELFNDGPANGVLEPGDVVLKIDGTPPDASKLYDYGVGLDGQKRIFHVLRGKKKLKLSIRAVSPI